VKIVGIAWDCRTGLRTFTSTSAFGQGSASELNPDRGAMIAERSNVGDLVRSNSEAGRVSGTFIRVRIINVDYKGHIRYGAPLRLRCENEFGFKMVKWITAIEFTHDFADLGAGQGGYNEDQEFYGYRMPI
jgi:hypothetical protein